MEGVESTHWGSGRRRVQDSYSWEGCGRLGPFHSVPAPLLPLLVPEHLGCSTHSQPQGQRGRLGELKRLPPSPSRQHRGRLNTCFLLPTNSSSAVLGPHGRPAKWHFLCLCSFHTRLYRSAILPILPPHLKIPRDPGLPSHFNTAPDLRGFPQGKKTSGRKLRHLFSTVSGAELEPGIGYSPMLLSPGKVPDSGLCSCALGKGATHPDSYLDLFKVGSRVRGTALRSLLREGESELSVFRMLFGAIDRQLLTSEAEPQALKANESYIQDCKQIQDKDLSLLTFSLGMGPSL